MVQVTDYLDVLEAPTDDARFPRTSAAGAAPQLGPSDGVHATERPGSTDVYPNLEDRGYQYDTAETSDGIVTAIWQA